MAGRQRHARAHRGRLARRSVLLCPFLLRQHHNKQTILLMRVPSLAPQSVSLLASSCLPQVHGCPERSGQVLRRSRRGAGSELPAPSHAADPRRARASAPQVSGVGRRGRGSATQHPPAVHLAMLRGLVIPASVWCTCSSPSRLVGSAPERRGCGCRRTAGARAPERYVVAWGTCVAAGCPCFAAGG